MKAMDDLNDLAIWIYNYFLVKTNFFANSYTLSTIV